MWPNVSFMHVLFARPSKEYGCPNGGTEHKPVFQPLIIKFRWNQGIFKIRPVVDPFTFFIPRYEVQLRL